MNSQLKERLEAKYLEPEYLMEAELGIMETEYSIDSASVHIFPFIRQNAKREKYIEVYVWDALLYPENYCRFIIADGYRMEEKDEEAFLCYVKGEWKADDAALCSFFRRAAISFPRWRLPYYSSFQRRQALDHMYFASHCSGAKEILYKAGLENIAYNLDRLPDCKRDESTPEKIVGHGLSLRLLRILNQCEFEGLLYDTNLIEHCRNIYDKFSGYIGKNLSRGQWDYLESLCMTDGIFEGMKFNRTLYNRLGGIASMPDLWEYRRFMELREMFPETRKWKIPHLRDLPDAVWSLERLYYYHENGRVIDELFESRAERSEYAYSSGCFFVELPRSSFDIAVEGIKQRNCVLDYIDDHADGNTTILFLRKTDFPNNAFVTMEVLGRKISQVFGRCNKLPCKEVYVFLEEYAHKKQLLYDPYELIMKDEDKLKSCKYEQELRSYAMDYKRRSEWPEFPCDSDHVYYIQLTLEYLFSGTCKGGMK